MKWSSAALLGRADQPNSHRRAPAVATVPVAMSAARVSYVELIR